MKSADDIRKMIRDARTCMLTTSVGDHRLHTRPMSIAEVDNFNQIWFFTDEDSSKVQEIQENTHLTLGFANEADSEWLTIYGKGSISKDRERIKDLWNPTYKAWFPQGLDTPGLCLLRVDSESAEYWESKGGRIATAFEMVKAAITGDPARNGENAVVAL